MKHLNIKNQWVKTILKIASLLLILLSITSISLNIITRHNRELTVPDFTQMSIEDAKDLAKKSKLRIDVTDSVYIRSMARGFVSKQNPVPGTNVKKKRRILLTINSILPKYIDMPSVIGYSLRQAKTELIAKGLAVGKLIYVEDMATNNVLAQQIDGRDIAPGEEVESESPIDLVLGINPRDNATFIPNLIGYKYLMAKGKIHDNSLNISKAFFDETVTSYSDSLEAVVYRQQPSNRDSSSYRLGSPVTIYLTKDQSKIDGTNRN